MDTKRFINSLLIATLIVLTSGLAIVWFVAPGLLRSSPYVAGGSIAACAVAMSLMVLLTASQKKHQRSVLLQYVQQLCDCGCNGNRLPEVTAVLGNRHPWFNVLNQIDNCIVKHRREIDELKHNRAAGDVRLRRLTDERDQLSEIVTSLAEPVVAIDHYDELVLANRSAQDLLGIDWDGPSTERQAVDRLVQCEELVRLLQDTRRRKLPTQRTSELNIEAEGATRSYRVTCTGISTMSDYGEDATDHGAVAVLNDISNEKAIQKRNADFVSSVSHEMKTPLAGIKAYVELLADGEADDEETQEEFLHVIDSQADRLQRLIENLLNLARIEAGVVQVKKSARSLNELLEEAINVVSPAAEQKSITLASELSPMYLGVLADRDMLMQTAINLLSNAIKYTPDGGAVTLRSRMTDDEIKFEVQDTGVGLNEEDCQRVFEKFYRVKENRDMASGTGLGLPLAKHIVEDVHNGKLTVDSAVGNGSTFHVSLPSVRQMNGKD